MSEKTVGRAFLRGRANRNASLISGNTVGSVSALGDKVSYLTLAVCTSKITMGKGSSQEKHSRLLKGKPCRNGQKSRTSSR